MIMYLENATSESIFIEYLGNQIVIKPMMQEKICFNGETVSLKLLHEVADRFNAWWYLTSSIIALSQMRTVLVVNGEYIFKPLHDGEVVKMTSREYNIEKRTSYQTVGFVSSGCIIEYRRLQVANKEKIHKRAKLLYLFGGSKSFLIPCGFLAILFLFTTDFTKGSTWDWIETGFWVVCFLILLIRYRVSLQFLKKAMDENVIFEHLAEK